MSCQRSKCYLFVVLLSCITIFGIGCKRSDPSNKIDSSTRFSELLASWTGIDFINEIQYSKELNPYQTITDIFTEIELQNALQLNVNVGKSVLLINDGNKKFHWEPLPIEAQFALVFSFLVEDFDLDRKLDILLGGNFYRAKPEVGRYAASYGLLLKGIGAHNFEPMLSSRSGFFVKGEIRNIASIKIKDHATVLVARNNDGIQTFEYKFK